jgi:NAD(P)-dependent dehydrogenase (short-subunit alcohol dehydrogenase family)
MAQKQFEGKVALVTGANSGIGLATAARMVNEGCKVALLGRDGEGLEKAARQIDPEGG